MKFPFGIPMPSWRHETQYNSSAACNWLCVTLLFALSVLIMLKQITSSSYFTVVNDDAFIYPRWAWQFIEALKEGNYYPRWLHLNYWGYGSPTFLLYPPLAYYLVALFNSLTGSVILSMNLAKFTSLFLYGVGMFYLVREFHSPRIALVTASLCVIFPYNVLQYYLLGTFASSVSFMWFPPIILYTIKFVRTLKYHYLICAGACYGGLILTHLINAYMFTFVFIIFICFVSFFKRCTMYLTAIPVITLTGFAVSAIYLLPLLFEKQYLNLEAFIGKGYQYYDFFILPRHFISDFWKTYYTTFSLQVVFFLLIILIIFLITKTARTGLTQDDLFINRCFPVIALGTLFLLFGASRFVWESIPSIKNVQFPARWLNITTFATLLLSAAGFSALTNVCNSKRLQTYLLFIGFLSLSAWDYYYIIHAPFYTLRELQPANAVNRAFEHLPTGISTDMIRNGNENKPGGNPVSIQGKGSCKILKWESAERAIHLSVSQATVARIRTFNFPGWVARVDGKPADLKTESGTGAMLVNVPEGDHELRLSFEDTPARTAGKAVSAISLIMILTMLIANFLNNAQNSQPNHNCNTIRNLML